VIGYIGAPEGAMTAMGALGAGDPLGKHIIVRAWATGPETDALTVKLPAGLPQNEKAEVIGAHRRHKQSVILLHFLARTLGAIAENDPAWIQNNAYSPKQITFSERNRELIQLGADGRIAQTPEGEIAMQLLASIEASEYGGWLPADKEDVVGRLRNVIDASKAGETAADVPAAAYGQFDHARTLARRQQFDDAIAELEPLIAAYPANATMRILVCDIELHRGGPSADAAKKACARAIELAAGDPRPHVTIAGAWMQKNDLAAARAELVLAEGKIANLPKPAQGWLELAEIYRAMGALTWAETAVTNAGATDHPVLAWVKTTRARYGVPASGKGAVKPEDEAAAVAAVRQILDAVYASKFTDAARAVKIAAKRYPGLPGVAAAWCDLDLRQEHLGSAKKRCNTAIAAYPNASWAQYLLGIIIMRDTGSSDTKQGIEHLKLAIAADPDLSQAWRALGKAYKRAKDLEALKQLEADYQARFGQALTD
jgi:tetratricopeptide (TPR) repeat protein